jgi:hypothetical protein
MEFWEMTKQDIQKSIKEGIVRVREGVTIAKAKAEELTEEGKRRLKILDLKMKVQDELSALGGRVYAVSQMSKNLTTDTKVKSLIAKIRKLEGQILKLEGKPTEKPKRKSVRRKTGKKRQAG